MITKSFHNLFGVSLQASMSEGACVRARITMKLKSLKGPFE